MYSVVERNMSRTPDSGQIDLIEVFARVQTEMLAHLSVGSLFEHGCTQGSATEHDWIQLFDLYLPKRYRTAPVFVVNADGQRSRQIDLAVFDNLSSPLLFPRHSALYVPIESVYAVFEVKSILTAPSLRDAGEKAASVRQLRSDDSRWIIAGILTATSQWLPRKFGTTLGRNLAKLPELRKIDLGCALDRASFEDRQRLVLSQPAEALLFFLLRLVDRLDALGPAPRTDLMRYARGIASFRQ